MNIKFPFCPLSKTFHYFFILILLKLSLQSRLVVGNGQRYLGVFLAGGLKICILYLAHISPLSKTKKKDL